MVAMLTSLDPASLAHERRRIGQILHDGLCQNLVGALFALKAVAIRPAASEIANELETVIRLLDEATSNARKLAGELNPPRIDSFELRAALCDLANSFKIARRLSVSVEGHFVISNECAEAALELATLWLQSAEKHHVASSISLRLVERKSMVEFHIVGGQEEQPSESKENVRLDALRARLKQLGDTLGTECTSGGLPSLICAVPNSH